MSFSAWLSFVIMVVTVSLSGVLMPGPVTAVCVARGAKSPHAGALVSLGHGVIEFPLMAVIFLGARALFQLVPVRIGIGLAGGLVLLGMGIGMLKDYKKVAAPEEDLDSKARSPLLAGLFLSAANPYFLVWWATAGAALIDKSIAFGLLGFLVLAVSHWLCDFAWFYFLSALSFRGGRFFGRKLQQGVFIICGIILLYFSGSFIVKALALLLSPNRL